MTLTRTEGNTDSHGSFDWSFYCCVTWKLQQTENFKNYYLLVILSPLFPQEMTMRHLFDRFIVAPRVSIKIFDFAVVGFRLSADVVAM